MLTYQKVEAFVGRVFSYLVIKLGSYTVVRKWYASSFSNETFLFFFSFLIDFIFDFDGMKFL